MLSTVHLVRAVRHRKGRNGSGKILQVVGVMHHELKDTPLDKNWALDQGVPPFGCIRRQAHHGLHLNKKKMFQVFLSAPHSLHIISPLFLNLFPSSNASWGLLFPGPHFAADKCCERCLHDKQILALLLYNYVPEWVTSSLSPGWLVWHERVGGLWGRGGGKRMNDIVWMFWLW